MRESLKTVYAIFLRETLRLFIHTEKRYTQISMIARLTVLFFALVCLMVGALLILAPWGNLGIGDWSNNYFIDFIVAKTGWETVHSVIDSTWFRGAVTGLGVFNIVVGIWELINFKKNVRVLELEDSQIAAKAK